MDVLRSTFGVFLSCNERGAYQAQLLLALFSNVIGNNNTATGFGALHNATGNDNTAMDRNALGLNTTGVDNIALGFEAGVSVSTATGVIAIGSSGRNA